MKAGHAAHLSFNIVNPLEIGNKLETNFYYQCIVFSLIFPILIDESIIKLNVNLA